MKKPEYIRVTMTLDKTTVDKAKALAAEQTSTVSGLVRQLVRVAWAEQHDKIAKTISAA
jgi:hypothetical protein